jgi:hypothetical protein
VKKPKYAAISMQQQSDGGINPFAVTLMAEAHADDPKRWGEETIMVVGHAHNGTPVYMLISTVMPTIEQFEGWPE